MGKKPKSREPTERIFNISHLTGKRRGAIVKEEVIFRGREVLRYSLAYVNPRICVVDNGRVLGYDNSHGYHHRHAMGRLSLVSFSGYEALVNRFQKEVIELWRKEDE